MGFRGLFEGWHIVILLLVVVVVFGWKRLPDASRSLGRSMRIFKAEIGEMKTDGKPAQSPASTETVRGDVVPPVYETPARPAQDGATAQPAFQPTAPETPIAQTTPAAAHDHQQPA